MIDMCVHELINKVCDLIHICLMDQQNSRCIRVDH